MEDPSVEPVDAPLAGETAPVSFGERLRDLAETRALEVGLTFVASDATERQFTWRRLEVLARRAAGMLTTQGVHADDRVAVMIPNSPEHVIGVLGAWKLGATVVPVRWDLPDWEFERLVTVISPRAVLRSGDIDLDTVDAGVGDGAALPEVAATDAFGICSSGSTGLPKVVMRGVPATWDPAVDQFLNMAIVESYGLLVHPQNVLVPAPMYHVNGFKAMTYLLGGEHVVLMERFDAGQLVEIVARHEISGFIAATPILQRVARLPLRAQDRAQLSRLEWVQQGGAPIAEWLVEWWCEVIGPESFYLSYGSSEGVGTVVCRGSDRLAHPGTLGRGWNGTEVRVLSSDGATLPPGEIGEIYMRRPGSTSPKYLGAVPDLPRTSDGFASVGDMGWLDDDGWLYMADRRVDLIVTGGANVYPAEVEAALSEHPGISDVIVIGLADPDWGRRVHALVEPRDGAGSLDADEVIEFAKQRLALYKAPKTVEFVDRMPRNEATKINRAALIASREHSPRFGGAEPS